MVRKTVILGRGNRIEFTKNKGEIHISITPFENRTGTKAQIGKDTKVFRPLKKGSNPTEEGIRILEKIEIRRKTEEERRKKLREIRKINERKEREEINKLFFSKN